MSTPPTAPADAAVLDRLGRIETLLTALVAREVPREWYAVEEFAAAAGLAPYTVREHCRLGRLHAAKKGSGRGRHQAWALGHAELLRFRRDGLLPPG